MVSKLALLPLSLNLKQLRATQRVQVIDAVDLICTSTTCLSPFHFTMCAASYSSSTVSGTSQVMFFNLPLPSAMPPSAQTQTSSQAVPYSTQQYRKRKQEREQTGTVTRKYVRKTDVILCRKCSKERKPPSHLQYFGNWYCKESETQSYGEWRAVLEERGYRKKQTNRKWQSSSFLKLLFQHMLFCLFIWLMFAL